MQSYSMGLQRWNITSIIYTSFLLGECFLVRFKRVHLRSKLMLENINTYILFIFTTYNEVKQNKNNNDIRIFDVTIGTIKNHKTYIFLHIITTFRQRTHLKII